MTYLPVTPGSLVAELLGSSTRWGRVLDNADAAYIDYDPPIFGPVTCSLEVTAAVDTLIGEVYLPANQDATPVACLIRWRGKAGYTATATWTVTDGVGSDSTTATTTASTYGTSQLVVTPTSSSGPRKGRLYLRQSTAGQLAQVVQALVKYKPAATFPAGLKASGAARFDGAWPVAGYPIPREVVQRAHNNIAATARSRPAGLAGGWNRVTSGGTPASGPIYSVTGTTWTLVERWLQPRSDDARRPYLLAVKLGGTNPEARMVVGPYVLAATGTGWTVAEAELTLAEALRCAIYLRSSSGGTATLETWQIMRSPRSV